MGGRRNVVLVCWCEVCQRQSRNAVDGPAFSWTADAIWTQEHSGVLAGHPLRVVENSDAVVGGLRRLRSVSNSVLSRSCANGVLLVRLYGAGRCEERELQVSPRLIHSTLESNIKLMM